MSVHVYVHAHRWPELSANNSIYLEDWKLDLTNSPSTATDERVQGTSHIQDTLTW